MAINGCVWVCEDVPEEKGVEGGGEYIQRGVTGKRSSV